MLATLAEITIRVYLNDQLIFAANAETIYQRTMQNASLHHGALRLEALPIWAHDSRAVPASQ